MIYGAMNFPIRPVLEEIDAIAGLGFDYLELTMDAPRAHHEIIARQEKEIRKALDHHGMKLVCHLPSFVSTADLTGGIRKASLREILDSLRVAARLRPLKVVLHPSFIVGLGVLVMKKSLQYAMESLDAIVELSDELGLVLCLENLFPRAHSAMEPHHFVELFDRFPSLRLTLDTGHAHIEDPGGRRAVDFIHRFPDRLGHVHVSDNFGKEDNHLPVGAGTVDFPRFLKALKSVDYNDTITLEIFSRDKDYLRISREKLEVMNAALS
jgi:sugar phosphate isomerase/epimerase